MVMPDAARILACVTGTVDQELLARNEYLVDENRILKAQLKGRLKLSDAERSEVLSAKNDAVGPVTTGYYLAPARSTRPPTQPGLENERARHILAGFSILVPVELIRPSTVPSHCVGATGGFPPLYMQRQEI
jgi:hypothetical protein